MKVVVTGATGFQNRGVEAIVVPVVEQTAERCPGAAFTVVTRTPAYDRWRMTREDVRFLPDPFEQRGRRRRLRVAASAALRRLAPDWRAVQEAIAQADVVLAVGGDVFGSDYGDSDTHLEPVRCALSAGRRVGLLGHSIGPFRAPAEADTFCAVAGEATFVTVREGLSYAYVTEELGLRAPVHRVADPAFLLDRAPEQTVLRLRELHGLDDDRPLVVLCPSQGIARFSGLDAAAHRNAWLRLGRAFLECVDARIAVLVHHTGPAWADDDTVIATELAVALDDPRVTLVAGEHSASELKGLIATARLVVSERMHAAIAGLSTGVPVVAVGYSVKARGILIDLYGPDLADACVIGVDELVADPAAAAQRIVAAWDARETLGAALAERRSATEDAARRSFDLVSELLGTAAPTPAPAGVA